MTKEELVEANYKLGLELASFKSELEFLIGNKFKELLDSVEKLPWSLNEIDDELDKTDAEPLG